MQRSPEDELRIRNINKLVEMLRMLKPGHDAQKILDVSEKVESDLWMHAQGNEQDYQRSVDAKIKFVLNARQQASQVPPHHRAYQGHPNAHAKTGAAQRGTLPPAGQARAGNRTLPAERAAAERARALAAAQRPGGNKYPASQYSAARAAVTSERADAGYLAKLAKLRGEYRDPLAKLLQKCVNFQGVLKQLGSRGGDANYAPLLGQLLEVKNRLTTLIEILEDRGANTRTQRTQAWLTTFRLHLEKRYIYYSQLLKNFTQRVRSPSDTLMELLGATEISSRQTLQMTSRTIREALSHVTQGFTLLVPVDDFKRRPAPAADPGHSIAISWGKRKRSDEELPPQKKPRLSLGPQEPLVPVVPDELQTEIDSLTQGAASNCVFTCSYLCDRYFLVLAKMPGCPPLRIYVPGQYPKGSCEYHFPPMWDSSTTLQSIKTSFIRRMVLLKPPCSLTSIVTVWTAAAPAP